MEQSDSMMGQIPYILSKNPFSRTAHRLLRTFPLEVRISIISLVHTGRWPHLNPPITFNDKIQARKLAVKNPLFPLVANKLLAKDYVRERLGTNWVTPTLWRGERAPAYAEVQNLMPFVIKPTHASGKITFVNSATLAEWTKIQQVVLSWPTTDYEPNYGEWWYDIEPREIFAEPLLQSDGAAIIDYKFYVFDGQVRLIHVDTDRHIGHKRAFFDSNWEPLPFALKYPPEMRVLHPPKHLEEMKCAAGILGRDFSFARIDLYDLPSGPRFGEITLAPGSGFERFTPSKFDHILGGYWRE